MKKYNTPQDEKRRWCLISTRVINKNMEMKQKKRERERDRRREREREEDERRKMKKMKPRLLCLQSFILGFTDIILNINISKNFIDDFTCEVKLKFLIRSKKFQKPHQILHVAFHSIGKRVNGQQPRRVLIISALKFSFCR